MTPTLALMPCLSLRCASNWLFRSSMDFAIWDDQCNAWSLNHPCYLLGLLCWITLAYCVLQETGKTNRQGPLAILLYFLAREGSSVCSGTPFTAPISLSILCMVGASAMLGLNAPLQHPGRQKLSKTGRSCVKTPSIAIPYLGTRGTCSS